jgi:undecaprenyl-diphosphatase
VAIAYSRLYLGVHWVSDVLGGFLFGAVVTAAFGVALEAIPPRRIAPYGLAAIALAAFLAAGFIHIGSRFARAVELYAPRHVVKSETLENWRVAGWRKLPARRIDLAGKPEEAFIVQWLGGPAELAGVLDQAGWRLHPKWHWKDSLPYLEPNAALEELAPRPILHEGLRSLLTWTRSISASNAERLVVRLWRSDYEVATADGNEPIYLVSLTRERLRRGLELYSLPSPTAPTSGDIDSFLAYLTGVPAVHIYARDVDASGPIPTLATAAR